MGPCRSRLAVAHSLWQLFFSEIAVHDYNYVLSLFGSAASHNGALNTDLQALSAESRRPSLVPKEHVANFVAELSQSIPHSIFVAVLHCHLEPVQHFRHLSYRFISYFTRSRNR